MIKRVTIFGDSYADPHWEKKRYVHETWYEKLEKQYEYYNFGFAGTGPHYSFKEFYRRYKSFNENDLIVFILSRQERINFYVTPSGKGFEFDTFRSHEALWDFHNQKIKLASEKYGKIDNEEQMAYAMKTFEREVINLNKKNEAFLYTVSRLQRCKICIFFLNYKESYISDRLNDSYFYIHKDGLQGVCEGEYINPGKPYYEDNMRNNHMVEENHIVLYEIIDNFAKGNIDNMPSFKNHLLDAPDRRFIYD